MRLALAAVLLLSAAPAFAVDAVTYRGTLDGRDIVVELRDFTAGAGVFGRFSYLDEGADIPLDAMDGAAGGFNLAEEAKCTADTCKADENGVVADVPVAAHWRVGLADDGKSLTGIWDGLNGDKPLPVTLTEIGRRTLDPEAVMTPMGLADSVAQLTYSTNWEFSPEETPYEVAKMDVTLSEGPEETLEGSTFHYVTDPRTKFAFPRVLTLSDGSSPDAINAALSARHAMVNYNAFDCLGRVYAGFGADEYASDLGAGTIGGYDEESIVLQYLSPTVTNWTESGSTFCVAAHPNNHSDSYLRDTKTGSALALGKIFSDYTAVTNYVDDAGPLDNALEDPANYGWLAGPLLSDYVLANRVPLAEDKEYETECGTEELIKTNLGMRFLPGPQVVFTIVDLPFALAGCGGDVLTVDMADIPKLLAPTAGDYFPTLAK